MTDTAIPTPEPAQRNPGDIETDPGALTAEQQRRVRALGFARDTLVSRGLFSGTDVSKWKVDDLLQLADWILDGSETPGVLFGVAVLPCPGESTDCKPFVETEPENLDDAPRTDSVPEPANTIDLDDAKPWEPEPEDDEPALIEPSGWTAPFPPEEGNPGREPVDAP